MRFYLLLLAFILFLPKIFSQSKLDSLVAIGNEQSFQFSFNTANKTFQKVISEYPESSLGYYYLSRNKLWFYLANKDSSSKASYLKYFRLALDKGEAEYDENSDNPIYNYNLGNIYLLKSIYSSTEQKTMDAFWATKSAVNYYEDAVKLDVNFYDPYLGLGTIKYALGFVPGFLGWAISVAGLDGEKSEGLNYILKAFEHSKNSRTEAAYHLGKIYTEYNAEYEKAEILLSELVNRYPQNELFLYQYAILQIDRRKLDRAEKYLNRITNMKYPKFHQTFALSFFLNGEVAFKKNDFHAAIRNYENFIIESKSVDYTGIANLKIALSYIMLNNEIEAKRHFILARNGNQNIAEDSDAAKKGKLFYDKKFSDSDKQIILAQNYLEAGKFDKALEVLDKLDKVKRSSANRLKIDLIKVEAYQQENNFEASQKILEEYQNYDEFNEYLYYTKLLYFLSYQYYHQNKIEKANEILEEAYDNLDKHNNKLNRLLVNLKNKINKSK